MTKTNGMPRRRRLMAKRSTRKARGDVVYGDVHESLVFIPRARARELAAVRKVLWSSSTWGELRSRLPAKAYKQFLARSGVEELANFDEYYREERKTNRRLTREEALRDYRALPVTERRPEPDDAFSAGDIGAVCDGDFPAWPQQEMLAWVPTEIQQSYGGGSFSFVSGPCLVFELENEDEIVEALERHGYRCVRDDGLVLEASGFG
jgi:hypothetical protein